VALNSNVRSVVEKKLEEYEGRYNHMYLDSKAKVTVGIGHLIANKGAVISVTMYTEKNKMPHMVATMKQKQDEYDNLIKQKKNYKASWYKQHTSLIMKDTDINIQRKNHIDTFYSELVSVYKKTNGFKDDFDNFPINVQKALFDMIFNLGQTNLRNKFIKFNDAIKQEKWKEAAKQSNRPDVNSIRNGYVKGLFNSVHAASQKLSAAKP
jgi:GH24 family phage-related lysozyme (muramidase)